MCVVSPMGSVEAIEKRQLATHLQLYAAGLVTKRTKNPPSQLHGIICQPRSLELLSDT